MEKQVRVLIVDDEPLVLSCVVNSLRAQRFQNIHTAATALHARALFHAERFDVVLCDISLPDGDGRQLLREALAINPHMHAVLMSGFLYDGLMIPADLYGKLEFLAKPFTHDELCAILSAKKHVPCLQHER